MRAAARAVAACSSRRATCAGCVDGRVDPPRRREATLAAVLLAIDVGNTNIVIGLFDGADAARTSGASRRATAAPPTSTRVLLRQLFALPASTRRSVDARAIVASVVPPLTDTDRAARARAFGLEPLVVGPGIKTGMPILYENPREVGADRIVNAVAALRALAQGGLHRRRLRHRDHLRLRLARRASTSAASSRPACRSAPTRSSRAPRSCRASRSPSPRASSAATPSHSMQSGIVYGYVGLVDGLVERARRASSAIPCARRRDRRPRARSSRRDSRTIEEVDDDLTLDRPAHPLRAQPMTPSQLVQSADCIGIQCAHSFRNFVNRFE